MLNQRDETYLVGYDKSGTPQSALSLSATKAGQRQAWMTYYNFRTITEEQLSPERLQEFGDLDIIEMPYE